VVFTRGHAACVWRMMKSHSGQTEFEEPAIKMLYRYLVGNARSISQCLTVLYATPSLVLQNFD
jgi:hypothetical protein